MRNIILQFLVLSFFVTGNLKSQKLEWAFGVNATNPTHSSYYPSNTVEDIVLSSSQDIYVCGNAHGISDFDPSSGNTNTNAVQLPAYFAKYDSAGNYLWHITLGDTSVYSWNHGRSMAMDGNGDIYVTGVFYGTIDFDPSSSVYNLKSSIYRSIFFGKYTSSGALVWMKSLSGSKNAYEDVHRIRLDNSGNLLLAGWFNDTLDIDPSTTTYNMISRGRFDAYVAKFDLNGNFISGFTFGGNGTDRISNMEIASNNDIILAGHFEDTVDFDPSSGTVWRNSNGYRDYFIARYDSSGNHLWSHGIGGPNWENKIRMDLTGNGELVIGGNIWGKVDLDPGSGLANKGRVNRNTMFLAKYSGNGNYMWSEIFGEGNDDIITSLKISDNDEILLCGVHTDSSYFNPRTKGDTLHTVGYEDIFIASYSDSAKLNWATSAGGKYDDFGGGSAILGAGNYAYFGGSFQGPADIDFLPGPDTHYVYGTNWLMNMAFAKYAPCYVKNTSVAICSGSYYVFPNGDSSNVSVLHTSIVNSMNTCDSVIITDLKVIGGEFTLKDTLCFGDVYTFPDSSTAKSDTVQRSHLTTAMGCDSVIITKLSVRKIDTSVSDSSRFLRAVWKGGSIFIWQNCITGDTVDTSFNASFSPSVSGWYKVSIYQNGCLMSSGCHEVKYVSVPELEDEIEVKIYPNPSFGRIKIDFGIQTDALIEIFNLNGALVQTEYLSGSTAYSILLDDCEVDGLYHMRIISGDKVLNKPFILKR